MSTNSKKLFAGSGAFDIKNVPLFGGKSPRSTATEDRSQWNDTSQFLLPAAGYSTLLRDGLLALQAYLDPNVRQCALMEVADGFYSAEYKHSNGDTEVISYNAKNGVLEGSVVNQAMVYSQLPAYGDKNKPSTIAALLFCMIPAFQKVSSEFSDDITTLLKWQTATGGASLTDEAEHAFRRCCDAFYYGIINDVDGVKIGSIDQNGLIPSLPKTKVKGGTYNGTIIRGNPTILTGKAAKKKVKMQTLKDCMENPAYADWRNRMDQLRSQSPAVGRIPTLPEDTYVEPYVIDIVEMIMATADTREPANNIRIEGPTGLGKTISAQEIAMILNLEYLSFNCDPGMDKTDLKVQIIPNVTGEHATASHGFAKSEPTLFDMSADPETAYEDITGTFKEGVTPEECLAAYKNALLAQAAIDAGKTAEPPKEPQFVRVLSELMKGLQRPAVIEIQEMSRANPAVLSGINEVFDRHSVIHLEATGEVFTRHPYAIIVSTDNINYPGCKKISPDVRRRFSHIERLDQLSEETAVARVKQRLGYGDDTTIKKMWKIIQVAADYCRDNNITDGDIGFSELMFWVQKEHYGRDRKTAFFQTVVNHATGDAETATELWEAVSKSQVAGKFFDA